MFFTAMMFLGYNVLNVNPVICVSMNNQECKIRTKIIDISNNPYCIKVNKCNGRSNNINDSCAKLCVPNVAKSIYVKVLDLISRTNETRHTELHETCKCKCRLDTSLCKSKQRCDNKKCRRECKELIDKGIYDKRHILNPNNCKCECD